MVAEDSGPDTENVSSSNCREFDGGIIAHAGGAGNFQTSTLLRKINQGDQKGACDQLRRWTYAKGKQWKGLVTRREIEREVCLWGQK